MKIKEAMSEALKILNSSQSKYNHLKNHIIDARIIMIHTLQSYDKNISLEWFIINQEYIINADQQEKFFSLIDRRANNEPVSHIIGYREFFGNKIIVNKNVLDPRNDSEALIMLIIDHYKILKNKNLKFLELFVGSGCLTISILKEFSNFTAIASDISSDAVAVAKQNIFNHNLQLRAEVLISDIFANLDQSCKFDFIIANPPYIPTNEIADLQPEVCNYEPIIALDGGLDGLDFYRLIAIDIDKYLKEDGLIFLEIGIGQLEDVTNIFLRYNFKVIAIKYDLSSIIRAICLTRISKINIL